MSLLLLINCLVNNTVHHSKSIDLSFTDVISVQIWCWAHLTPDTAQRQTDTHTHTHIDKDSHTFHPHNFLMFVIFSMD